MLAKTSFMIFSRQTNSGCVIMILVSSAKRIGLDIEFIVAGRSLMES
jgi:hypothetical protein